MEKLSWDWVQGFEGGKQRASKRAADVCLLSKGQLRETEPLRVTEFPLGPVVVRLPEHVPSEHDAEPLRDAELP